MANDPSIYDTREHLDFARRMAESLLKEGNYVPNRDMATLPGSWMYGIPNVIRAISGAQYRDIAGDRESKLISDVSRKPNIPAQSYGRWIHQPPSKADIKYSGGNPDATAALNEAGRHDPSADVASASGDDFIKRLIQIESGGNPNARTGSYRGLGQFGRAEEQRYGIDETNWNNPQVATDAIKKHIAWLTPQLEKKLGRPPTPGELYLAHQQGAAGGPALLSNPDQPAWKAIRPYYNSDQMAKLAITGNIPNGHYLKKIPIDDVKASDFAQLWTSRFDTDGGNKLAGARPPGMMNLGGPKVEGEIQPTNQPLADIQLAQAGGPNKPVMTTNPPVSPPIQAPGYGLPPANPVLTQDQLDATLRLAPAANRAKIMDEYQKSREGRKYETPTGSRIVTPPGQPGEQPIVTDMPSKTFPLTVEGVGVQLIPNTDGGFDVILPNGERKTGLNSLDPIIKWAQDWKGRGTDVTTRSAAAAKRYEEDIEYTEKNYKPTRERGSQLRLAEELVNDPKFIAGSFQQKREAISKFFQTIGVQPPGGGADVTQAFVKLISGNILEDIKGLGGQGLGQVRQKEMEIIERMNAMPDMSPGAIMAVVKLTKRMNERVQEFQDKMLDYAAENNGQIDYKFYHQMRKHYSKDENHFMTSDEIKEYGELFKGKPQVPPPRPPPNKSTPRTYVPGKGWQ